MIKIANDLRLRKEIKRREVFVFMGNVMKDNKYVMRFLASTMAAAVLYGSWSMHTQGVLTKEQEAMLRPFLNLTTGEVVDPATAPEVTKFSASTAKEFAEMVFGEVEETPDINEFLSRFTCSSCGKKCLLTSPRCSKGQGSQEKAVVIYQEMFPEVEL